MLTGFLCTQGWHGFTKQEVEIIGRTPKKYRIKAIERTRLGGANRWLNSGEITLVPQKAVRDHCELCGGMEGGVPGNENFVNGKTVCDFCHAKQPPQRTRD